MLFNRTIKVAELLQNLTDCHSHILPDVDNGVGFKYEALQILSYYEKLGIKRVIFTPHIMENINQNNLNFLKEKFTTFKSSYDGKIELILAAEYMLDSGFPEQLESNGLLTLFKNYLLVEISCITAPINLTYTLTEIIKSHYVPVLAHPERYIYLSNGELKQLKKMGVKFQLNLTSILGSYGKSVKQRAELLLSNSMYDMIGSDIHSFSYYTNLLNSSKINKKLAAKLTKIKNMDQYFE